MAPSIRSDTFRGGSRLAACAVLNEIAGRHDTFRKKECAFARSALAGMALQFHSRRLARAGTCSEPYAVPASAMSFTFHYAPEATAAFPSLASPALVLDDIAPVPQPGAEPEASLLAAARARLAAGSEGEWPEVQAWRRAFSQMGLKPTQYRSAAESLRRRLCKEGSLPRVHPLVDLWPVRPGWASAPHRRRAARAPVAGCGWWWQAGGSARRPLRCSTHGAAAPSGALPRQRFTATRGAGERRVEQRRQAFVMQHGSCPLGLRLL